MNQGLLFYELSWIDDDKTITEKIAQQTLVAQKINLFDKTEKKKSYQILEQNHQFLLKKITPTYNYNPQKLTESFEKFKKNSEKLNNFDDLKIFYEVQNIFLEELNQLRIIFSQKKENDKLILVYTEVFITLLFVLILLVQWFFTFKPIWKKLKGMSIEITDINQELQNQINEVKTIEQELRSNMEELELLNENLHLREKEAKEQEKLLNDIQNFAGLGYFEVNFEKKKSVWSEIMYDLFGLDKTSSPPFDEEYFNFIHPQDKTKVLQIMQQLKNEDCIEFTHRIIKPNKEVKYLTFKIQNSYNQEGKRIGFYGTTMDVTMLKQAQIELEHIHEDVLDSLNYAQRIQNAILPNEELIKKYFPEHFVLYSPKDIVSGDFYWISHRNYKTILVAGDCTGHGIPGAFMSFIGTLLLNEIVNFRNITSPEEILNELRRGIKKALRQEETGNHDGMDATVLTIDQYPEEYKHLLGEPRVEFAGANNPLYYIQDNELFEIKGSCLAVGGVDYFVKEQFFKKHNIDITKTTYFYMFSDGYQDQFGGERNSRFTTKRFKNLLLEIHQKPMEEQKSILRKTINEWTKNTRQIDDILVIGLKIINNQL
jgi:serine phosphatase RsbU (regulator of sigma subunit)